MPRSARKKKLDLDKWSEWFCTPRSLGIAANEPHKLGLLIGREKLLPLHGDWIRYCWDADEPRALQAFRGSYKSTSVGVVGIIRWMLFNPNDRIALIRKTFTDAAEVVYTVARAMDMPQVQELFKYAHGEYPRPIVRRDGLLRYSFKESVTPEGNLVAKGLNEGITGLHFDKLICDDIITLRDRVSRAEREHTIELVRELITNIIDPGKGSIWIGTPWHREDAWKIIQTFCEIWKNPLSECNFLGDEFASKKRKTTTPYLFSANFELQLNKDESLLFSEPVFGKGWDFSVRGATAQLDTAFDGDHYCALTIAAPIRTEGTQQIYQAIGFVYPGNIEDWEAKIDHLCKKYRVKYIYVETNADKGASAKRLAARGLRVKPYAEGMNKHIKIGTYLYEVWNYIEWAPDTDDEYMIQVTEYKEGIEPDDAPDSAASLFREAFSQRKLAARAMYEW
jgi:hypothetical protein